ncbi:branched-chain amino acid ABC transporter permease [Aquabacter spiritensis]|uniref:Amino acid/amide ABC transporter membrane protein 2 (HAAT family) n=1 Tax=Aquabacter spiritensis TaxID=933073 RepID=A0A4R3LZ12_9HYPH|nr:branched-chain amino acid ABC transporter permease [Aquabacter spiritensis]TCT05974.1 amino acid/amide ABC transporter membrane protein 2 (HAAT family) [Aquabacter spiritensis]
MTRSFIALLLIAVLLALVPFMMDDFFINLCSQILCYALFAVSLNLIVGYGGMTSLGHAAYFGIAAYAVTWLHTVAGWDHLTSAIGAVGVATGTAAVFGVLALRASGLSFLMITLALGQIVWGVAYRWVALTQGDNGMRFPQRPAPFGIDINGAMSFYYFSLIVFAVSVYVIWRVVNSPFGASLRGARDQPRRMRMLGHDVWMIRWAAFVMSGFWAAVAGLLFVYYQKFVSPYAVSLQQSAEVLLMTILGGASTLTGPMVGAIIVTLVKNVASTYVERWNALLGLIFVLAVVFMPTGLVPGFRRLISRKKPAAAPADETATPPAAAPERAS